VRAFICVPLLLLSSGLLVAAEPAPRFEWDIRYLEREWGLRLKNVQFVPGTDKGPAKFELLLGLDRDIPETFMSEFAAQFPPEPSPATSIVFYAQDFDNVAVGRGVFYLSAGELTGKAGDAFKVTVLLDKAVLDKVLEKRVLVPGHGDRPVLGLPRAGDYRGALILRVDALAVKLAR
jgi:hypothetical protein